MAVFRSGSSRPLDFRLSQTFVGTTTISTTSQIEIVAGSLVGDYFGQGFAFTSAGALVGGTVTGYSVTFSNSPIFTITGVNIAATTVNQLLLSGNQSQLKALVLAGDDTIYGAGNGDVLLGFGGTNTFIGVQSGVDYVAYQGAASAYTIAVDQSGFRVTRPDGGHDELINIKGVDFTDRTILLGGNGTTTSVSNSDYPPISTKTVGIYRFFSKVDGTHFFTASTAEANQVASTRSDLAFEGIGLTAVNPSSAAGDNNSATVFRFFDTLHGTHFYTTNASERDAILHARSDLTFEGTAFYGHTSQQSGDAAVYRFFNTADGTHFYTSSASEAAQILSSRADLKAEGVGFYVPTT